MAKLEDMNMGKAEEKAAGYGSAPKKKEEPGFGVVKGGTKLDKEMGTAKAKDEAQYKNLDVGGHGSKN